MRMWLAMACRLAQAQEIESLRDELSPQIIVATEPKKLSHMVGFLAEPGP